MLTLSVVINTKNAAQTLGGALESVKELATEIVIVDMKSSDNTVEVAERYTDKIFPFEHELGFADPARNFALSNATGDWILVLDADEEVSLTLAQKLRELLEHPTETTHYFLPRKNLIFQKWIEHTGWWPDDQLRFFKRGSVHWTDKPHTAPIAEGKGEHLPAKEEYALVHHNYQSVAQFIERLNRYTDVENRSQETVHTDTIVNSFSDELMRRLFAEQGIEDGMHGVTLSFLQAMYELTVTAKQWQRQGFSSHNEPHKAERALREFESDLNYWLADWHVRHSVGFAQILWKLRRKWHL